MAVLFTIDDKPLSVTALRGEARMSALFSFEVRAESKDPPAISDFLGKPFELTLGDTFGHEARLSGLVLSVEREADALGQGTFLFELGPEVAKLAIGKDHRVFQDRTAVEIVKEVLDAAGIPAGHTRFAIGADPPKRTYCAQYDESDWDFVERLCAEEGLHYAFERGEGGTVIVFGDDSTSAADMPGGAAIPYRDDDALAAARGAVLRVGRALQRTPDAVRLRDYDPDKPKLELDALAGEGPRELYDWAGRFRKPADGERLARTRLEARTLEAATTFGETTSTRPWPGLAFELEEHPIDAMNGRYLVKSVKIESKGARAALSISWTAQPIDTPFRARREKLTQGPAGPQTGVVVCAPGEEIHPDDAGRIRVQFYWDRQGKRDDKASTFMRVGQFALGGSMVIPRKGWEVLASHHEGDIDAPVVTSHLYDGLYRVPYSLPANKTRTAWQTATTPGGGSSNEVRFEDKAGSEELFLQASKDMNVVVGDTKQESVSKNHTHEIGANHDVTIGENSGLSVGADQKVSIGGSETISVGGERLLLVAGSESATIGGSRTVTAASGVKLEATGARSLTVGGTMTAVAAAEVSRQVLGSLAITVGGSMIQATATGLANMTLGAGAETVGGAKIHASGAGVSTNVKGALAETVGGAYVITAGGNVAEGATSAHAITVGGAFVANAPKILVEAESEISIRVGAASITITPSSIEVKAPSLASPCATISKTAGQIHHN